MGDEVYWEWENYGGVLLRRDGVQGLKQQNILGNAPEVLIHLTHAPTLLCSAW